jgi:CBS domain containing-hemolysin-like protein
MEDVIEELVGDIADEYDKEVPDVEKLAVDLYRVNARFSLFELGELLDIELEDDDVDSVGGWLTKSLGALPKLGDQIVINKLELTADRVEGRAKRLVTVLVRVLTEKEPEELSTDE